MKSLINKLRIIPLYIKKGDFKSLFGSVFTHFYSEINAIGLEVNITDLMPSKSKMDTSIRRFKQSDLNALHEGLRHIRLVQKNIPDCYVAITKGNTTIYRQWVFTHEQNEQIASFFNGLFPKLKKDEALIEGVFTHPDYRGMRVMPNAIYKILNQKQYAHINRVIVFVDQNNIASLKGFKRNGFTPYILRQEKWLFFKRQVSFKPLTNQAKQTYLNLGTVLID